MNCIKAGHFAKVYWQEKTKIDIDDKIIDGANSNESAGENETYQFFKLSQVIASSSYGYS